MKKKRPVINMLKAGENGLHLIRFGALSLSQEWRKRGEENLIGEKEAS